MTTGVSPRINRIRWGEIRLDEGSVFKDAKLYPGGSREWDWNETGTRHVPGIQPADLEELLTHEARVIILSKGVYERLQVCPETLERLEALGIPYHVLPTPEAVQRYNELHETEPVGGLFHSTC